MSEIVDLSDAADAVAYHAHLAGTIAAHDVRRGVNAAPSAPATVSATWRRQLLSLPCADTARPR